jgi:chorismate dehydratase
MWRTATGLPFVFALWAVRPERVAGSKVDFVAAMREGVAATPSIARRYSEILGRPYADLLDYLTSSIHYGLDAESLEGLALFYRLAAEEGLIPPPRPLVYWPE